MLAKGKCARKACKRPAHCLHRQNKNYYCPACARAINDGTKLDDGRPLVLFPVTVLLIDDDEACVQYVTADVREVFENSEVIHAHSPFDAAKLKEDGNLRNADLIVTDLSAVGSIFSGQGGMYAPICNLIEKLKCPVVINSAVSRGYADQVRDDIVTHLPEAVVRVAEFIPRNADEGMRVELRKLRNEGLVGQ